MKNEFGTVICEVIKQPKHGPWVKHLRVGSESIFFVNTYYVFLSLSNLVLCTKCKNVSTKTYEMFAIQSLFFANIHTLYNVILRIARNFLETRVIIKILTHPCYFD